MCRIYFTFDTLMYLIRYFKTFTHSVAAHMGDFHFYQSIFFFTLIISLTQVLLMYDFRAVVCEGRE